MFELNLPKAALKLSNRDGKPCIWDAFRKKWLQLTPEEFVRQHLIHYLCNVLQYPGRHISIERGVTKQTMQRRTDIVVYNSRRQPHILIECKAPFVNVNQSVIEQASAYNTTLKAPYLCVSNGIVHACFRIDHLSGTYRQIDMLPEYTREDLPL